MIIKLRSIRGILPLLLIAVISCSQKEVNNPSLQQQAAFADISKDEAETLPTKSIDDEKVFICKSRGAKKYHYDQNCRGLKQCTHTIEKVDRSKAQELGLGLCGWED